MSIRRTFSAEMLPQSNPKRVQDDDQMSKKGAFDDIWSSIQKNVGSGQTDDHNSSPYVHPLVKRSTSLLTQKSLEVCTESLGSETGSDTTLDTVRCTVILSRRRSLSSPEVVPTTTSFPPPLTSLAHREGSNLHMRAHRRDGRLVVEAVAVTVTAVKSLCAHRHDGRLLLTLNDDKTTAFQQEEEKTTSYCAPSTLVISKLTELTNCRWPRNMNTTIVRRVDDSHALKNAYDSYWKNVGPLLGPLENKNAGPLPGPQQNNKVNNNNNNTNNNKGEEKMEKEEDYERIIGGCKRKSSLLLWDSEKHPTSFYIATS